MNEQIQELNQAYRQSLLGKAQFLLTLWQQYAGEHQLEAALDIDLSPLANQPPPSNHGAQPEGSHAQLHQALHRLAGSAPMYDLEHIGKLAQQALLSLKQQQILQFKQNLQALLAAMFVIAAR